MKAHARLPFVNKIPENNKNEVIPDSTISVIKYDLDASIVIPPTIDKDVVLPEIVEVVDPDISLQNSNEEGISVEFQNEEVIKSNKKEITVSEKFNIFASFVKLFQSITNFLNKIFSIFVKTK